MRDVIAHVQAQSDADERKARTTIVRIPRGVISRAEARDP